MEPCPVSQPPSGIKMSIKKAFACVAIAASAFTAQAQNLVVNGSFEDNVLAAGTWGTFTGIVGWQGTPDIEIRNAVAGSAQEGSNYVELDTSGNSGMFQQIATGTGWYALSFWFSAREGVAAGSNGLNYSFGDLSGTVLANVAGTTGNVWQQYTGLVYLNGVTNLVFSATGKSDSLGGSLDNVSVTAVPEPETYAMMLAGLVLMGSVVRRRKSSVV